VSSDLPGPFVCTHTTAMLARHLKRSLIEHPAQLPPTFLLPFRARITTLNHSAEPNPSPETLLKSTRQSRNESAKESVPRDAASRLSKPAVSHSSGTLVPPAPKPSPSVLSQSAIQAESISPIQPQESITALLPLLRSQTPHYITAHIYGRPYLVTAGDVIRLPFLMHGVTPGDILRLNCATHLGSRDFTLKAPPAVKGTRDGPGKVNYLDDRLFVCRAVVMGVKSEPMRVMEKTKRRQRHIKQVKSKHRYTVLRITELEVKDVDEIGSESLDGVTAEKSSTA
jgi:large subunit ribosomal protein L21